MGVSRRALILSHDVAVTALSFPLAYLIRQNFCLSAGQHQLLLTGTLVFALVAWLVYGGFGAGRSMWRFASPNELLSIFGLALAATAMSFLALFLVGRLDGVPRGLLIIQPMIAVVLLCGARVAYVTLVAPRFAAKRANVAVEPLLLVGGGDAAALVIMIIARRMLEGYCVVGIVDDRDVVGRTIYGVPILGSTSELPSVLGRLAVQGMMPAKIVVTCPHHELVQGSLYRVADIARRQGVELTELPDLIRFRDEPAPSVEAIEGRSVEEVAAYSRLRRLADVILSGTALLLLAPLLLLIASAVRLCLGSPVFFDQVRPGRARKRFTLRKFRTMHDPLGPDGIILTDAQRTPWLGRLLRRTRTDELPQLINVFMGDMSVIGPRPLLPHDIPTADPEILAHRYALAPGITGWAQVNGGHSLTANEKLALDLYYIRHRGLMLDVRIITRTLEMMLFGERVERKAIEEAETISFQISKHSIKNRAAA